MAWLLCGAAAIGIVTWCVVWWVGQRRARGAARARGVHQTGPAPAGSAEYLEALCRVMDWQGVEVAWYEGRIPAGYGDGTCDAQVTDAEVPRIECRRIPGWRLLLDHEAGEVERRRAGLQGEPTAERVAEIGRAVARCQGSG